MFMLILCWRDCVHVAVTILDASSLCITCNPLTGLLNLTIQWLILRSIPCPLFSTENSVRLSASCPRSQQPIPPVSGLAAHGHQSAAPTSAGLAQPPIARVLRGVVQHVLDSRHYFHRQQRHHLERLQQWRPRPRVRGRKGVQR